MKNFDQLVSDYLEGGFNDDALNSVVLPFCNFEVKNSWHAEVENGIDLWHEIKYTVDCLNRVRGDDIIFSEKVSSLYNDIEQFLNHAQKNKELEDVLQNLFKDTSIAAAQGQLDDARALQAQQSKNKPLLDEIEVHLIEMAKILEYSDQTLEALYVKPENIDDLGRVTDRIKELWKSIGDDFYDVSHRLPEIVDMMSYLGVALDKELEEIIGISYKQIKRLIKKDPEKLETASATQNRWNNAKDLAEQNASFIKILPLISSIRSDLEECGLTLEFLGTDKEEFEKVGRLRQAARANWAQAQQDAGAGKTQKALQQLDLSKTKAFLGFSSFEDETGIKFDSAKQQIQEMGRIKGKHPNP